MILSWWRSILAKFDLAEAIRHRRRRAHTAHKTMMQRKQQYGEAA